MKYWMSVCVLWLLISQSFGQGVSFFTDNPDAFIAEFSNELNQNGAEIGRQGADLLGTVWSSGQISIEERETFIQVVNIMVSKRFSTAPDLSIFALTYAKLFTNTSYVKLPANDFLSVTRDCVFELDPKRTSKYLRVMYNYINTGHPIKKDRFYWFTSQSDPKIIFDKLENQEGVYSAPAIVFEETDLFYATNRYNDSSRISSTGGKFYPLSLSFIGEGGRVTWEKVGFPKDVVYADLAKYTLNLNYGLIKADTVTFFYKDLIDQPLVGRFEDRNIGFKDKKKANYPYFQSYEGGVVIENFIPNVRYEGGFSLKGIRRIGSSYDINVEPEEEETNDGYTGTFLYNQENLDNTYSDDEWDNYEEGESSFSSEDSWSTDSDEWTTGGSYDDDYWGADSYQFVEHIPAKIEVRKEGKVVMKLSGEAFVLDSEKMVGKQLKASIYTSEKDSIFHPQMDILYTAEDSIVILKKPKRSVLRQVPFISSYHEFFLFFETIKWDLRRNELEFTAFIDREHKISAIESFDYFTKARFDSYKGILKFNPIGAIYRYAKVHPKDPIFPSKIMEEYNLMRDLKSFERALPKLEGAGFITYNQQSQEITPLPKLFNWARAARKKKDFDAIQILSQVDTGSHGLLGLEDMEIEMAGVRMFSLSDSVFVRCIPSNEKVIIQENRNLKFGGTVAAGRLNFYASDSSQSFTFDYESYKILCDSLDSIRFVLTRDQSLLQEEDPLKKALSNTVFEGVSGAIHIDHPNNKSGEKDYAFFPVFDSYSNSYLYWASPEIEGGVYSKEKMHFAVDPFVLDSLEDFEATNLLFDGEFNSSEIFPSFRQQLQVMDDFTLGFRKTTPPEGYRIYEGNGRFKNEVILDNNGLQGDGTIEYLGTIAASDSFVFHFDSVMAEVHSFNLRRGYRGGVYFPHVDAANALYTWYTKENALSVRSKYEELVLFEGQAQFTGELSITEKGMVGTGEIVLGPVKVRGDSIVFSEMDFKAADSDFIVLDEDDPTITHFIASNVDIEYNVRRHESKFGPKAGRLQTADFPIHKFSTSLVQGEYNRANRDLELVQVSDIPGNNYFVSVGLTDDPMQDSLKFNGQKAYYGLDSMDIIVDSVREVRVADAIITPVDKQVIIGRDGYLKPLVDATVEADQDDKLHKIYEATIQVAGRNDYSGFGKYDYIEIDGQAQYIEFNDIKVNSQNTTVASGEITEEDGFYLTERIFFRGNAFLDASSKFLDFEGEVKIESENEVFRGAWFVFERTTVNPDSVFIPIADDLTNALGEPLTVGLNYYPEGRNFYSTFLQSKEDDEDEEVLSASGGLTFDRKKKEFKIGAKEKLLSQVYKGSTVAFNDEANTITSNGYLKFPSDFEEKTIGVEMSGSWKEDLNQRKLETDLLIGFDMSIMPKEILEELAGVLLYITRNSNDIDFNQRTFLESASELLDKETKDEKETQKLVENVQNSMVYTDIKMAEQLPYTLLLSGVNFNYDRSSRSLYCDSEVGLIGLGGRAVNKKFSSRIVYQLGPISAEGDKMPDIVTIYLEVDEFNWFYFHFEEDVLYTVSPYYDEYNTPLREAIDKRKNNEGFRFELATEDEKAKFLQDFVLKFIRN